MTPDEFCRAARLAAEYWTHTDSYIGVCEGCPSEPHRLCEKIRARNGVLQLCDIGEALIALGIVMEEASR